MPSIDLNCDMGESFGVYTLGADDAVLASISSANIACGFHAGDPAVMGRTVRAAAAAGVAVGAHPGLPDLAGFGRREMQVSPADVEAMVAYQLGALYAIARIEGVPLQHVKPHGALYNMAAVSRPLAEAIARAIVTFDPSLLLFAPPGSELHRAADAAGLGTVLEGFADRAYEPNGTLTPRSMPGAVIDDVAVVVQRAIRMAAEGVVTARDGTEIAVPAATICTHGDTPGAPELTRQLRAGLERAGVRILAPGKGSR